MNATESSQPVRRNSPEDAAVQRPVRPTTLRDRASSAMYDHLLWRLQGLLGEDESTAYALGLMGFAAKAGVTTIAANLALRAAEQDWGPVLLIETDWHAPRLASRWGLSPQPGAARLFAGNATLAECVQDGPVAGLHVLPAGSLSRRQQPRVNAGAVREMMAEARVDYRLILVDLPPAERIRQELALARLLDQTLLVVRAESARSNDATRVAQQLRQDGVELAGAILNRHRSYLPNWLRRRM
ncbi:MAG: hypothetical protein CMJ58_07650 [Planctomycetaceae bacterium]|nr:hypothetical protein [Planctomycetaceae bacterium]